MEFLCRIKGLRSKTTVIRHRLFPPGEGKKGRRNARSPVSPCEADAGRLTSARCRPGSRPLSPPAPAASARLRARRGLGRRCGKNGKRGRERRSELTPCPPGTEEPRTPTFRPSAHPQAAPSSRCRATVSTACMAAPSRQRRSPSARGTTGAGRKDGGAQFAALRLPPERDGGARVVGCGVRPELEYRSSRCCSPAVEALRGSVPAEAASHHAAPPEGGRGDGGPHGAGSGVLPEGKWLPWG